MLCRDCCFWCVLALTQIITLWFVMSCYELDTVYGMLHSPCHISRSLHYRTATVCLSSDSAISFSSPNTVTTPYVGFIMSFYSCVVVLRLFIQSFSCCCATVLLDHAPACFPSHQYTPALSLCLSMAMLSRCNIPTGRQHYLCTYK